MLDRWPVERLPDVMPHSFEVKPVATFEAVQEIAIYIHRFHNLDLFNQGWYQIKITMRWEDNENISFGIPARVVQYEAPDLGPNSMYGIWRIDDSDSSFSTQPFRIKYARQDIHLCMMVSFNLSLDRFKGLPTTSVILKFELMFAPTFENGADLQASLDDYPAAVHEFRIPPKALLGLHSYCPVHFDALHAVLIDVSVHVSLLKAKSKAPSNYHNAEVVAGKSYDTLNKGLGEVASADVKNAMFLKALILARDILLEELQKLSKAVDGAIEISMNNGKILNSIVQANQFATDVEISAQGKPQNGLEIGNGSLDFLITEKFHSLSGSELLDSCHSLGEQLLYLWNIFRKFHRDNKTKILEFLRDTWAKDRKAEWSIWMVYSKVEMPHRYINSEESSFRGVHRRVSGLRKFPDEPLQTAATRAELHRRSIAQMRGNHLDLRLIRNQWLLIDPKVEVLMSKANEDKTSGDFREMAQRLAREVVSFVKKKMDKASTLGNLGDIRLSFVGHSIGNLIIRTAIAESIFEPFLRYLHTYVSVSGPHLGYLYSSNSLFNSGLWLLKKLKGTQCIHQLTFTDDPDIQNTFLYKLCQQKTLDKFRHVILLSSPQLGKCARSYELCYEPVLYELTTPHRSC